MVYYQHEQLERFWKCFFFLHTTYWPRVRSLQVNLRPRPWCIDRAIARSIHHGRGLRFPCNDRTDEVNKLFIIWPFFTIRTPEVIFHIRLRAPWLSLSLILNCFCMLVLLSVIENIVVPPFDHLFCCFRPRARCHGFTRNSKRAEKSFIMPGHYKKIMPTQQPIRAGVLL